MADEWTSLLLHTNDSSAQSYPGNAGSEHGNTVATDGTHVIVSSTRQNNTGAIFILTTNDTSVTDRKTYQYNLNVTYGTTIGHSISINENYAFFNGYNQPNDTNDKYILVYKKENGEWPINQSPPKYTLTPSDTITKKYFGVNLDLYDNNFIASTNNGAIIYDLTNSSWMSGTSGSGTTEIDITQQANTSFYYEFNYIEKCPTVGINNNFAIIGDYRGNVGGNSNAGCVYIYKKNSSNGDWDYELTIENPDYNSSNNKEDNDFGLFIQLNGDNILIRNHYTVWVYKKNSSGNWDTTNYNKVYTSNDMISSATTSDDIVAIGFNDKNNYNGLVYIYKYSNSTWSLNTTINPPSTISSRSRFGSALDMYEDKLVVTAPYSHSGKGRFFRYLKPVTLTIPVVQSVEIKNESPSTLEFTFDQTILDNTEIRYEDFSVTVDGTSKSLGGIQIKDGKLYLTLDERIFSDNTVLVSFTKPGTAHVANLTIDTAGDYALQSFTDQAVTNSTTSLSSSITISTENIIDNTYTALTNRFTQYTDRTNLGSTYIAAQLKKTNNNYYTDGSNRFIVTSHGGNVNKSLADPPKLAFPEDTSDSSLDEVYIGFSQQKIINALKIQPYWNAHTTVKEIRIYGSNDNNATKTLIETINIPLQPNKSTFTINFSNATSYKKYTFQFTQGWVRATTPTNWSYLIFSLLQVFHKQTLLQIAESDATSVNLSSDDISTIKTGSFTISNGKSTLDNTRKQRLRNIMTNASNATDKRKKRRAALKLLFAQDQSLTKMVIPKTDLDLPEGFTKTNALVVKAGQSISISDLESDEGFYSVLNDGETVDIVTDNTTLTFTREDVGDTEQYIVDATGDDWSNIVINSDDVSTSSTFSDSNTDGFLLVGDSVTIDGRIFIIGSVADGGAGGSGGDPYVFPIKSSVPVKLPNKSAVYRMFEQGNNYVNVEVGKATENHKQRMYNYARKITPVTHNIVMDGYFYQKAFISAEGHKLTLDYGTKKATSDEDSMKFFNIKQSKKHFDCGEFSEDAKCWTVEWTTKENKKIQTQLMFFPNPHIENGINVLPSTLKNSTGLIVDNYKPKLMELPSLTTEKFDKLHRKLARSKNVHQKISIKGKNEKWHFK